MTNEQTIRTEWSTKELAEALIREVMYEDFDYDWEENLVSNGVNSYYQTSDNERFSDYDEAVGHEIWWLEQEVV